MNHSEDDPMAITDAQLEAMTIEQRNAILADTTDIRPAPEDLPPEGAPINWALEEVPATMTPHRWHVLFVTLAIVAAFLVGLFVPPPTAYGVLL